MPRQCVQTHQIGFIKEGYTFDASNKWDTGPCARVDENQPCLYLSNKALIQTYFNRSFTAKIGIAFNEVKILSLFDLLL